MACRLAIIIAFPVTSEGGQTSENLLAFITYDTAGELGAALGILAKNVPPRQGYVRLIVSGESSGGAENKVEPAQVHLAFTRELAAAVAGAGAPDKRVAVLVGAGAIGSQIAIDLAREGKFSWCVVDQDYLLPHNFARHALYPDEVGAPKAGALARRISQLLEEPCHPIDCDVLRPGDKGEDLAKRFAEADLIIDTSASVAVSRHLADMRGAAARRVCAFFNPTGTAVVLLAENADRSITLRDLEAQYHRLVQVDPRLDDHLSTSRQGLRYSGSCRSLTNRIPATKAALLSAIAGHGIVDALKTDEAAVRVWCVGDDSRVEVVEQAGAPVHHVQFGDWIVTYDDQLLNMLSAMRGERLPAETGGILLGIVDTSRKSIHVPVAFPQPEDSHGNRTGFERGVVGLSALVDSAVAKSMHQLRYVGEWHSHPRRASAMPSGIDLMQIAWLGREMEIEGLPGLMAIAADSGTFTFVASAPVDANRDARRAAV